MIADASSDVSLGVVASDCVRARGQSCSLVHEGLCTSRQGYQIFLASCGSWTE